MSPGLPGLSHVPGLVPERDMYLWYVSRWFGVPGLKEAPKKGSVDAWRD